ncbi:hypothetical protein IU433_16580 [Nocardia puris]|uniref:hypothetical protein n=1 Tax=Nocardia puris TaxID=208602 RepID=UPI001892DC0E|nr:hypothetical protein [Nocardia puris]MBF6211703.1 hypothetical protein [Nocardia puris]MBF6365707.1 hypothetical protein [Nocardia puris]MBF6460651.1 hypothetical protein [Nocardia puris]
MSDDEAPSPLANLITEAREGRLGLRIEPEDFVYIDRDCQRFLDLIDTMKDEAEAISNIENSQWGIGADVEMLTSAQTLVSRFKEKAKGSDNSVYALLDEHYKIVQDIQTLHNVIKDRYIAADAEFAQRVNALLERLPDRPTPIRAVLSQPGITPSPQPEPLSP